MKRVELSVDIVAPAGKIWTALTTPVEFPKWIKGMLSVELLTEPVLPKGSVGDYGVGTRYQVTAGRENQTVEWTVEVNSLDPQRRIEYTYTGDVEGSGGWSLAPLEEGEGYRVTSFDEFAPPGSWLIKLLSKLWLDNANRAARRESLEQLKEMLEREGSGGEDE